MDPGEVEGMEVLRLPFKKFVQIGKGKLCLTSVNMIVLQFEHL